MRSHFWHGPAAVAALLCVLAAGSSWAEDAKPKVVKKPPSECAGLDNAACTAKPECTWYKQITMKNGKPRKAHCQKKPTHAAKKPTPTTPAPKT